MARKADESLVGVVVKTKYRDVLQLHADRQGLSLSKYAAGLLMAVMDADEDNEQFNGLCLGTVKIESHGVGGRIQLPLLVADRVCSHAGQLCAFYPILGRPHSVELRPI